ncbi:MAG: hypothetical protein ACOZNI_12045 [Myxococcota bacterium]
MEGRIVVRRGKPVVPVEPVEMKGRLLVHRGRRAAPFDPELAHVEGALRSRTARKVRGHLRRLEPVAMLTPRWSAPQGFLEDLALDLAVGQPAVGCRTVSFRPLMGRTPPECWNFILRVLAELPSSADWGTRPVPMVCDRRGFYNAAEMLLATAHEQAPYPVALLGHGAEHLPVEVLGDLAQVWTRYLEQTSDGRRCTVMLAGAVETPALDVGGATRLSLTDFGEAEAAATMLLKAGPLDGDALQRAVRFSGGVPAIVDALATGATTGKLPRLPADMLRLMGPVAEELKSAVEMALMTPATSERLHVLLDGEAHLEDYEVDHSLLMAGLVRHVRVPGLPRVALRAPALAAVSI